MNKKEVRGRRARKTRMRIRLNRNDRPRLSVYRSLQHIYVQIIIPGEKGDAVVASASTLDKQLKSKIKGNKTQQAKQVGQAIAERAKAKGIVCVAFDRSGFKYHGRVQAVADAAREGGLDF